MLPLLTVLLGRKQAQHTDSPVTSFLDHHDLPMHPEKGDGGVAFGLANNKATKTSFEAKGPKDWRRWNIKPQREGLKFFFP